MIDEKKQQAQHAQVCIACPAMFLDLDVCLHMSCGQGSERVNVCRRWTYPDVTVTSFEAVINRTSGGWQFDFIHRLQQ